MDGGLLEELFKMLSFIAICLSTDNMLQVNKKKTIKNGKVVGFKWK